MKLAQKYKPQVALFVNTCYKLAQNKYVTAHGGNLAWKLADDLILITPTQINKADIQTNDIVFINCKGDTLEGTRCPTGEKPMYLKFFAERPDVISIIHSHPPNVCAAAIRKGKNWLERPFYPEMVTEIGPVPVVPYAEPLTKELAEKFSPYIKKYNSFIMQNHGLLTVSRGDIQHTRLNVELLEATTKSILIALAAGDIHELDYDAVAKLDNTMKNRNLPLFGATGVNNSLTELYFPER